MRVLVTATPKFPIPPEQMPALMQGFVRWRERYRSRMEAFYFFAGGNGGGGIVTIPDEAALSQMMLEWPFSMFSDLVIQPIIDGDVALKQWQAALQAMAGGAS
ncbi:MAG: hypothetical protein HY690_19840 [Chloroflexi bacterium]|nr:hypothetical protein [Chloroflexota bacterium]